MGLASKLGIRIALPRDISIVLYHHVSDDNGPLVKQLVLRTDPDVFEQHVKFYAKNYDFIGPDELNSGRWPKKSLLITFDDAYRSVISVAGPILKNFRAPSIFFINSATVCGDTLPIDNILSAAAESLGLEAVLQTLPPADLRLRSVPEVITKVLPAMSLAEITAAKHRLCAAMETTVEELRNSSKLFLNEADLPKLRDVGVEVANHTTSHVFLRSRTPGELEAEISANRFALERLTGRPVRYFSVPYGDVRDATPAVQDVARKSGHRGIFLVLARSNYFRPAPDIFYRISPGNAKLRNLARELFPLPLFRSARDMLGVH